LGRISRSNNLKNERKGTLVVSGSRFVWQLLRIVIGYILAVLAAGFFLSWGVFQGTAPEHDPIAFAAMIGAGFVTASVIGSVSLFPAIFAIGLAESLGWRGVVYHVGAAGLVALGLWTAGGEIGVDGPRPGTSVALAAGFLGGLVYWLIAGRGSGLWRASGLTNSKTSHSDESEEEA
jgi:membrane protease YdiL (CAAX protease family)